MRVYTIDVIVGRQCRLV